MNVKRSRLILAAILVAALLAPLPAAAQNPRNAEDDSQVAPIPEGYQQRPGRNIAGPGDYALREKLMRLLSREPELAQQKFRVILVNGGVVFSGEMETCALKMRALRAAASVRGVINVTDEMRVPAAGMGDPELRKGVLGVLSASNLGLQDLDVQVEGGIVTLAGTVRDFAARVLAEDLAGQVVGVSRIANRLRAADAPSGSDDPTLARAVAAYISDFRIYPYPAEIQVRVRDGIAHLTGRSNLYLGRVLAGNMASQVGGIRSVDNRIKVDPSLGPMRTRVRPLP